MAAILFEREARLSRCLTRKRSNGKTENYTRDCWRLRWWPPGQRVLPLMPEFIVPQSGAESKGTENATQPSAGWNLGERLHRVAAVYLGDALFSSQPMAGVSLTRMDAQDQQPPRNS